MKQKQLLILRAMALLMVGCLLIACGGNEKNKAPKSKDGVPVLTILGDSILPPSLPHKFDIKKMSLQELRLLRSYPYALHGYHFMEADINNFFSGNTDWYSSRVGELLQRSFDDSDIKFPETYDEVSLSKEEKEFVERIDKRIEELKTSRTVDREGYQIWDPQHVVNFFQFSDFDADMMKHLVQNNFAITEGKNNQLFHVYEENNYGGVPNFITTDLFLQTFHMYFTYVLKSVEKNVFIPTLKNLCRSIHQEAMLIADYNTDSEIKQMAEYTMVFYAISYYIFTGQKLYIPEAYQADFESEIENINRMEDVQSSYLGVEMFYYSLFKPRGHYTRSEESKNYFKGMMWLQTAVFCKDSFPKLKTAVFQAALFDRVRTEDGTPLSTLYKNVNEPINFLMGEQDNLSILDIVALLKKNRVKRLEEAVSDAQVKKIDAQLGELLKVKDKIRHKVEILPCQDKINFIPQRYLADNEVLQELVDTSPNSDRAYPKGLDVFAAFGDTIAENILTNFYKEQTKWSDYMQELTTLKEKFRPDKPKERTVYNAWLKTLFALQKTGGKVPGFMYTTPWKYKNLNTGLASWAELKHDAILYGEQPMAAECGGGDELPTPIVVGYVEPNIAFWNKLQELLSETQRVLKSNNCYTYDIKSKTESLSDYISFLIGVTEKELRGEALTPEEYSTIEYMGSSIEHYTLSIIEPDKNYMFWSEINGPDKSIAVVADIYTRAVPGCDKQGVLHVGTGLANNIYVVVEIEGNLYLTRGATFSYYEFVRKLDTRLTDEEWQDMLENKKAPPVPEWMEDLILNKEPNLNERSFYSSGC